MTTHRRYVFEDPRQDVRTHARVSSILADACATHWWFRDPEVTGREVGRLVFSFTVSGRDQWFAHKRAMGLASRVYLALGLGPKAIPEPLWEPLAPHTNRGRFRVPAGS